MKHSVLLSALLLTTLVTLTMNHSFAFSTPGAPSTVSLPCESVSGLVGVEYHLDVITQTVSPQYSIRGITLIKKVVVPNAKPESTLLQETKQDLDSATFSSENVRVTLDKESFTANIYIDSSLAFVCGK